MVNFKCNGLPVWAFYIAFTLATTSRPASGKPSAISSPPAKPPLIEPLLTARAPASSESLANHNPAALITLASFFGIHAHRSGSGSGNLLEGIAEVAADWLS